MFYNIKILCRNLNRKLLNIIKIEHFPVFICFFLIIFHSCFSNSLNALSPRKSISQYKLEIWNLERGFPQNSVLAILQSRDGYLWLGTFDGLVNFDGIRFKTFNQKNTKQLKSDSIRCLYEDSKGIIWIGTMTGGVHCFKDGMLKHYKVNGGSKINVYSIIEDQFGVIWIGTLDNGVFCIKDEKISVSSVNGKLPTLRTYSILEDKTGNIWIGTRDGLVKRSNLGLVTVYTKKDGLADNRVYSMYQRRNGELWIGTKGILNLMKDGNFLHFGMEDGLPGKTIACLFEDNDGNLWIGTDSGGLVRMRNRKFTVLSVEDGLKCGYVYSICEDNEGSLWFGTLEGGLHRLMDTSFVNFTTSEGLFHNYVKFVGNVSGNLLVGTYSGLNILKNEKLSSHLSLSEVLKNKKIFTLIKDKNGYYWIGTRSGLLRYKSGNVTTFKTEDGLFSNYIHYLLEDESGRIWIGTEKGLNQFDNGIIRIKKFANIQIKCIYEDSKNQMWIGTGNRLCRKKGNNYFFYSEKEGIPYTTINCIHEDIEGILYIGTTSGMFRIEKENIIFYGVKHGLVHEDIRSIIEDNNQNFWISSRDGISCIRKQDLDDYAGGITKRIHPFHYNEEDGMVTRWFNYGSVKTNDGKLCFPSDQGLVMVDPANLKKNNVPPPVIIEQLKADGETIDLKSSHNPIIIPPGKRRLEFQYTALSFRRPRRVQFRYMLEGFDRQWHDMGNTRSTSVASLSPGKYTFHVIACNDDGVWNNKGASLSFYVEPYFYQTTWFYIFVILFAATAIFSGYRYRIRQLIARKRELRSLVDLRTRDLNERTIQLEKAHHSLQESKKIIEIKNQKITSSIEYAQRIQEAVLPTDERMRKCLVDYFIIYEPKDIVSGDFYWFHRFENHRFLIATADCTGHGVPGAILSMIGCMTLDEIVNKAGIYDPQQILYFLHLGVRGALKQEEGYSKPHDGMDMALCLVDLNEGKIIFSGAKRPLYCIIDSELLEIKGNKKSIGGRQKEVERTFESNEIKFQSEITLYLTSDGFADQNDRENNKYGSPRLREFLAAGSHLDLEEQKKRLLEEFQRHRGDEEQRDDVTIIGIKLKKGECL